MKQVAPSSTRGTPHLICGEQDSVTTHVGAQTFKGPAIERQ
jgi:hypothetical protein